MACKPATVEQAVEKLVMTRLEEEKAVREAKRLPPPARLPVVLHWCLHACAIAGALARVEEGKAWLSVFRPSLLDARLFVNGTAGCACSSDVNSS